MNIITIVFLLGAQPASDGFLDAPPLPWVEARAPFGMDITLDGKVWINTNAVGARDDYAILANDLHKAVTSGSTRPRLWIRGFHAKNAKVSHRESKQLVQFDCARETLWIERRLFYDASKELVYSEGPLRSEPVVPGSIGESWYRAACKHQLGR